MHVRTFCTAAATLSCRIFLQIMKFMVHKVDIEWKLDFLCLQHTSLFHIFLCCVASTRPISQRSRNIKLQSYACSNQHCCIRQIANQIIQFFFLQMKSQVDKSIVRFWVMENSNWRRWRISSFSVWYALIRASKSFVFCSNIEKRRELFRNKSWRWNMKLWIWLMKTLFFLHSNED